MRRLFGTNGIRGVVNKELTLELATGIGQAIGTLLGSGKTVVIGTDTRSSNEMLKSALSSGLLATGVNVTDIGIVPTPAVQFAVPYLNADFGVIITASHNPPEFNGIKCVDSRGVELLEDVEENIESIYFARRWQPADWFKLGAVSTRNILPAYIESIVSKCDSASIRQNGFKVVVDCVNGASCFTTPYVLERLGCSVLTLNSHPAGLPAHHSEPTPDNLKELMRTVPAVHADIGIAHDGDADRAIFIDELGNYISGDWSLALCAKFVVEENKGGVVVTPVTTSSCVEEVVRTVGGSVLYTKVGSPTVAKVMIEKRAVFGGEENGGLIFANHIYGRDGAMSAAKMLEIMAKTGKTLSQLADSIPKYALYKTKVSCPEHKKQPLLEKLMERVKSEPVKKLDTTDGVKIFTSEGWVIIRPSGTEPLYRVYGEAKEYEHAKAIVEYWVDVIKKLLATVT